MVGGKGRAAEGNCLTQFASLSRPEARGRGRVWEGDSPARVCKKTPSRHRSLPPRKGKTFLRTLNSGRVRTPAASGGRGVTA